MKWFPLIWVVALCCLTNGPVSAETIFHDPLTGAPGNVTNSVPALDVEGRGWQLASADSDLELDGQGHLFNATIDAGGSAGVPLIPLGPDGSLDISVSIKLPPTSSEWVGFGFGNDNQFLAGAGSKSGPWLKVQGDGSLTLYGGTGQNNPLTIAGAYTNNGDPVRFALAYDAHTASATVKILANGVTNVVLSGVPVTNTLSALTPAYMILQFPQSSSPPDTRWASDIAVDWLPRPCPLLAFTNISSDNIFFVGAPTGGSDINLIQSKLNKVATNGGISELRFMAGATYILTNASTTAEIPESLTGATNVWINGNGCKILIQNPHLGFLNVGQCQNVIVQGFSIDYDPLPFTQGVVTSNASPEAAFEFRVDDGYPNPTNDYFLQIKQWGTFMDPTRPGRLADGHSEIYDFDTVTNTATANVFKVKLKNAGKLQTIHVGDIWCQFARFNGATLYRTRNSEQVTYLDLTNYTGAAAAFEGADCSMVNEINCQVVIGPSPGGANGVPRRKTTNADGGLFTNPRIGPWVEGCYFTGMGDDVANANVLPFFIAEAGSQATNKFHLSAYAPAGGIGDFQSGDALVGDSVTFFNGTNGAVFDQAIITAINPPNVTFDHAISGVFAGKDLTNTLIFDNSLNSSAVYINNQFLNSRVHGIYCRPNNILVAHNFVSGMASSAVVAYPALSLAGPESFVPTNAVIIDNVLADGGWSYEATNNLDPQDEPVWALLELHKSTANTDYVSIGTEISGIRILNNAFLQWARAAIDLHNVSDANIIGNYFGVPMTNGLPTLTTNVAADLWACDYNTVQFKHNILSPPVAETLAFSKEGGRTQISGAFDSLTPPQLGLSASETNFLFHWNSVAPAFILQQADGLNSPVNWSDVASNPFISGTSNSVSLAVPPGVAPQFYRLRQR